MEFKCSLCGYASEYKKSVERHFNNKIKCGEGDPVVVEVPTEIKCKDCGKSFTTKYSLRRHMKICKVKETGIKEEVDKLKEEIEGLKEELKKSSDSVEIPLRDKTGNIKAYTIIDSDDYERVNKFKWCLCDGYASSSKGGRLHRFILNAKKEDMQVDHINNIKLDNRKSNLRFVTPSQNLQNKPKKDNCTSKYKGVSFSKKSQKWRTLSKYYFEKEDHAAFWYDMCSIKSYGNNAKINQVERPKDFVEPINKPKRELPTGVIKKGNKYQASVKHNKIRYYLGTFEYMDDAIEAYNNKKDELNILCEKEVVIEREECGIAFIKTKKGEKILVDDDKYVELKSFIWNINAQGYARTYINSKNIPMHRYLLNAKDNEIVDHINGNRHDNRLINLRFSNPILNSHNRIKLKGTSKYVGVYLNKKTNKFQAGIKYDKRYHLGSFDTEKEAAEAYNKKALELYGEYANLNTIEV